MADQAKTALITEVPAASASSWPSSSPPTSTTFVLVARSQDELHQAAQELQQQYGVQVTTIAKDLMQRQAPFDVYDEIKARASGLTRS